MISVHCSEEHVKGVCRQDGHGGDHEDVLWDEECRDVVGAARCRVDLGEVDLRKVRQVSTNQKRGRRVSGVIPRLPA